MIASAKLPDSQVCSPQRRQGPGRRTLALARTDGEMAQNTRVRVEVLSVLSARSGRRRRRTGDDDLDLGRSAGRAHERRTMSQKPVMPICDGISRRSARAHAHLVEALANGVGSDGRRSGDDHVAERVERGRGAEGLPPTDGVGDLGEHGLIRVSWRGQAGRYAPGRRPQTRRGRCRWSLEGSGG